LVDILSHSGREKKIHILTLDSILAADVYERIHHDQRMKRYRLVRPHNTKIDDTVAEIDAMARDTVSSKLLIIDVRADTLPLLQKAYNRVVGYNRRDLNRLCYTILIGDGPQNLLQAGRSVDSFVPYLAVHRVDYSPVLFFYDPLLQYEHDELPYKGIDERFVIPNKLPRRLVPYFKGTSNVTTAAVRYFFRATDESPEVKAERLQVLIGLYKKRIAKQFPHDKNLLDAWLSKEGVRLATEKLNLYPLFFEDWVHDLMEKPDVTQPPPL
jgi:hypothetical protein